MIDISSQLCDNAAYQLDQEVSCVILYSNKDFMHLNKNCISSYIQNGSDDMLYGSLIILK